MRMMGSLILILCIMNNAMTYADNGLLAQNGFGYIGQPQESAVPLQTLGGYRFYDAQRRHFLKQDSDSAFGGQALFDGYNYAVGNPVLMVDKNGHVSSYRDVYPTSYLMSIYAPVGLFILFGLIWFCRGGEDPGDECQHIREAHDLNGILRREQERIRSARVARLP